MRQDGPRRVVGDRIGRERFVIPLFGAEQPYGKIIEARLGSYWNIMIKYALGSGVFVHDSEYADAIIVKEVSSPERLLAETTLFLHRVEANLPHELSEILEPYMDIMTWDVHAIAETPYEQTIEQMKKELTLG